MKNVSVLHDKKYLVTGRLISTSGFFISFSNHQAQSISGDRLSGATGTIASAINFDGLIVDQYRMPDGKIHGFILRNEYYDAVDIPGSAFTMIRGINDSGYMV